MGQKENTNPRNSHSKLKLMYTILYVRSRTHYFAIALTSLTTPHGASGNLDLQIFRFHKLDFDFDSFCFYYFSVVGEFYSDCTLDILDRDSA